MARNSAGQAVTGYRHAAFRRFFLAFESPGFRWLWGSSFFGAMAFMTRTMADGWLVLTLTDSPFWVGTMAGIQGLGQVSCGLFAGVFIDRMDRRKCLIAVQIAGGTLMALIAILVVTEQIALWHLLVVAFFNGMLTAFQLPASNTLLYQVVGPHKLLNAMAARMLALNIARIVGSVIAGALISKVGIGSCYLFLAGSIYISPILLLMIKGSFRSSVEREPFWSAVRGGIAYAWANSNMRTLLFMSILMEMFGFSHMVMLPVMARDVLHVGATGLGYLSAASGVGAMISIAVVAGLGDFQRKGALLMGSAGIAGMALIMFAASPWFPVSLLAVALIGGMLMTYDATMGTTLQLLSSDAVRGRVVGLYGFTFGFTPIGGLLSGSIATLAGAPVALGLGGVAIATFVLSRAKKLGRLRPAEERVT